MAVTNPTYGTATAITMTLASLADWAARECTAVDNTSVLGDDVGLYLKVKMGAAAPTGDCYVILAPSVDGTNYAWPAGGTDAGFTTNLHQILPTLAMLTPGQRIPNSNLIFLDRIACVGLGAAGSTVWASSGIANILNAQAPCAKFSIILVNATGQALDATEGSHTKQYRALTYTTA